MHACIHIEGREMTEHISDSEHLAIFRMILAGLTIAFWMN